MRNLIDIAMLSAAALLGVLAGNQFRPATVPDTAALTPATVSTSTTTTTTTVPAPGVSQPDWYDTSADPDRISAATPTTTAPAHYHAPARTRVPPAAWSALVVQAVTDASIKWGFPLAEGIVIVQCESGGDPSAKSPTNDWGLWQHNLSNPGGDARTRFANLGYDFDTQWDDPFVNSDVAGWLWAQSGWQPWACRRNL